MKKVVIINAHAGRGKRRPELVKLLTALENLPQVEAHLLRKGEDPAAIARCLVAQGAEVVGAAGGDGTVSAVANALAGTETALAVIPFGTLNHFARDLGVPSQAQDAVRLLLSEESIEQRVDLGRVNERYFLNNSSLGLYPHLVRLREKHEARLGKWLAYMLASFNTLRNPVYAQVSLPVEEEKPLRVWLVFVSNNKIEKLPRPGYRPRLDEACLDLYVLKSSSVLALFGTAFSFFFGNLQNSKLISNHCLRELEVSTRKRRRVTIACDGEVFRTRPPIHYEIVPQGLKVRLPRPTAE